MLILGIESSCDETALALVNEQREIVAQEVFSQVKEHQRFGGVVPEIAARSHVEQLPFIMQRLQEKKHNFLTDITAIAATTGPGLIGGLVVGSCFGKAMAWALGKPFLAINHLEAHALTPRLSDAVPFPYILLLASGGHCQYILVKGVGQYLLLGGTIDDAAGEAFDKVAKMLGIGFPGGPAVEKLAAQGNGQAYAFPRPLMGNHKQGKNTCNVSFAGLKTAVRQAILAKQQLNEQEKADICASFQQAVIECLQEKTKQAISISKQKQKGIQHFVVAGGVAANMALRAALEKTVAAQQLNFVAPPLALCTDNAAMVAWAGVERYRLGYKNALTAPLQPRWPLSSLV